MKARGNFANLFCAVFLLSVAPAAKSDAVSQREQNRNAARTADRENTARFKDNADVLVLPGLVANRLEKTVRVQGAFTGLGGGAAAEFFLVPDDGEKDYEAVAAAFAAPSDIARALEFIGLPPGRPVGAFQLWPKGERVVMTFHGRAGSKDKKELSARAEEMMIDLRTGKPLPQTGLVYVGDVRSLGSRTLKSIASNYNESATVLDVPRQMAQGEVYEKQEMNPAFARGVEEAADIVIEPQHKDGTRSVAELSLRVQVGERAPAFLLTIGGGEGSHEPMAPAALLTEFARLSAEGRDPFVTVSLDPKLPLRTVRQICTLLGGVEGEHGVRIEPPPAGQLFFKAFLPEETLRDSKKVSAPHWVLRLRAGQGGTSGELTKLEAYDGGQRLGPFPVHTPADVVAAVRPAVTADLQEETIVFAPGALSYGELLAFLEPFVTRRAAVFVFLSEPAGSSSKPQKTKPPNVK